MLDQEWCMMYIILILRYCILYTVTIMHYFHPEMSIQKLWMLRCRWLAECYRRPLHLWVRSGTDHHNWWTAGRLSVDESWLKECWNIMTLQNLVFWCRTRIFQFTSSGTMNRVRSGMRMTSKWVGWSCTIFQQVESPASFQVRTIIFTGINWTGASCEWQKKILVPPDGFCMLNCILFTPKYKLDICSGCC